MKAANVIGRDVLNATGSEPAEVERPEILIIEGSLRFVPFTSKEVGERLVQGLAATLLQSESFTCGRDVDSNSNIASNFVYSRPRAGKGELPHTSQRESLDLPMKTSNKDERMGAA